MTSRPSETEVLKIHSFPSLTSHLRTSTVVPPPPPRTSLTDAQRRTPRSAQEIESLRAAVLAQTEKSTLTCYVTESTSLQSPIRKLPVELIGEIFTMHCTRGTGNVVGEKSYCPALQLSQVCCFWREVMLSRTELWGNLEVRLEQMSKGSIELLKMCLGNSKASSLKLRVTSGYWNASLDNNALSWEALLLLLQNSHRWFSATLRLDYQLFLRASKKITDILEDSGSVYPESSPDHAPFALLQHADVSWFDCRITSAYNEREPIRLFEGIPSLRSLTVPHYDDCFVFPLSHLETLNLTNVHRTPAPILSQTTNLKRLSIQNFAIRDPGVLSQPQISNITHLDIQVSSYFQSLTVKYLLDHLELPYLESFVVSEPFHRYTDRRTWSQEAFLSLLKRSGCQLKNLGIIEILVSGEEVVEILGLCPELEQFTFFEWQVNSATRKVLDGLIMSSSAGSEGKGAGVAPRLSRLAMRVDGSLVEDVACVVESRASSVCRLEEVMLQGVDMVVEGPVDFGVIRANGTRVVLRHEPTLLRRVLNPTR
ncbi:hypothetical protein V5O48_007973 [Marasmius crinis-equi]|uniref:F-box domain-containing protein n=1 Tax=Marasmius crinis-equi TaxID=585013 RepID=A0ABR3FFX3_9AGAR